MFLFKMLLILIMLSGTLYMNYIELRLISVGLMVIILILPFIIYSNLRIRIDIKLLLFLFSLLIIFVFSSFINQDIPLLLGGVSLVFIMFVLIYYLPNTININILSTVNKSLYIVNIPLVILSIFIYGLSSPSGIFLNPNSYGIVLTALFVVILSDLYDCLSQYLIVKELSAKKIFKVSVLFFVTLLTLFLIIQTNSRSSFLIALLLFFTVIFLILIKVLKSFSVRSIRKFLAFSILFFAIGVSIYLIFPIKELFLSNIYYKFMLRSTDGNILSGRDSVWEWVINNSNLFGHGRNVFEVFGIGAHNTFISLLGQYGLIAFIMFVVIILIGLKDSIKYYLKQTNELYRILPFLLIMMFVLQSMTEGMFYKASMFYAFISIGIVRYIIVNSNNINRGISYKKREI